MQWRFLAAAARRPRSACSSAHIVTTDAINIKKYSLSPSPWQPRHCRSLSTQASPAHQPWLSSTIPNPYPNLKPNPRLTSTASHVVNPSIACTAVDLFDLDPSRTTAAPLAPSPAEDSCTDETPVPRLKNTRRRYTPDTYDTSVLVQQSYDYCKAQSREDTIRLLQELGFTDGPSLAVFSSMPNLPPDLPRKLQIFLSKGLPSSTFKRIPFLRGFSHLCAAPLGRVAETVELVGPLLVGTTPEILTLRLENIREKVQLYKDLGIDCRRPHGKTFYLFSSKLETIRRHLTELQELGFPDEVLATFLKRYPYILVLDVQRCIKPALALIEGKTAMQGEEMHKALMLTPGVICCTTSLLQQKLQFFEDLGLDLKSKGVRSAFFYLYRYSVESLFAKTGYLAACGISWEGILRIVVEAPRAISSRQEALTEKMSYLLHHLNLGMEEMFKYPKVFSLSLEKRIKPRFDVVFRLKEKGLLQSDPSLKSILSPTDAAFKNIFMDKLNAEAS